MLTGKARERMPASLYWLFSVIPYSIYHACPISFPLSVISLLSECPLYQRVTPLLHALPSLSRCCVLPPVYWSFLPSHTLGRFLILPLSPSLPLPSTCFVSVTHSSLSRCLAIQCLSFSFFFYLLLSSFLPYTFWVLFLSLTLLLLASVFLLLQASSLLFSLFYSHDSLFWSSSRLLLFYF